MSKSDDLRKRLEALNRKPLSKTPSSEKAPELEGLRARLRKSRRARESSSTASPHSPQSPGANSTPPADGARHEAVPSAAGAQPARRPLFGEESRVELERGVEGTELTAPSGGRLFYVERRPAGEQEAFASLFPSLASALQTEGTKLAAELKRAGIKGHIAPERLVYFDLETTGLGSSPLFLIGAMVVEGGELVVKQYFARDYTEERAVLDTFFALCEGKGLIVSFNGKSFDVPFVRMRAAYNGLACDLSQPHLDLLHASRRIWRRTLPDCKLQTLESHVCGRWRTGDIPGSMIPDAYHDFVHTRNAARMIRVLEHNFLDLVTLAEIMVRMPGAD